MRLRHVKHLVAVLVQQVIAISILLVDLQITVLRKSLMETVLQHGKGSIGISHAVDSLGQMKPYGRVTIKQDVGSRRLIGINQAGVSTIALAYKEGTAITDRNILGDTLEGRLLLLFDRHIVVLRLAGRVTIDLRRYHLNVIRLRAVQEDISKIAVQSCCYRTVPIRTIVIIAESCGDIRRLTHGVVDSHRNIGDDIARSGIMQE